MMGRSAKNLVLHELIGLTARVVHATDPALVGLEGRVVDETMHLIVIQTPRGEKRVQKRSAVFAFYAPDGSVVVVDGRILEVRPEERTKKLWRRRGRKGIKKLPKQDIVAGGD